MFTRTDDAEKLLNLFPDSLWKPSRDLKTIFFKPLEQHN